MRGDGRRRGPHHHRFHAFDRAGTAGRLRAGPAPWCRRPISRRRTRPTARSWPRGARIRLCKGAYDGPASVAYRDRNDVTDSYLRCLKVLMAGSGYPMVASHDPAVIAAAGQLARESGCDTSGFECQMQYGIRAARAAPPRRREQRDAGVRAVRHPLVRVLRQVAGRTTGQPDVRPARVGRPLRAGVTAPCPGPYRQLDRGSQSAPNEDVYFRHLFVAITT